MWSKLSHYDGAWSKFSCYEKMLWKVVWVWKGRVRSNHEPQELFNELVVVYADIAKKFSDKPDLEFGRILYTSCSNHLCLTLISKNKTHLSIDDVILTADRNEFEALYQYFFVQEMYEVLSTEEGREIFNVIVEIPEVLLDAQNKRRARKTCIKRNHGIHKEDLLFYFTKECGWAWSQYQRGVKDVEEAYSKILVGC